MKKPRLLDLFCCAGGAGMGYHLAGFEVVGVDINPQPNYPFEFHQADAIAFSVTGFDAIHASPPCQAFTKARKLQGNSHPNLIPATRVKLTESGLPFVIENVPGSPLNNPVELCGLMFGLNQYRHRLFESNIAINVPEHPKHTKPLVKMGRPPKDHEIIQMVGHFSGVERARKEISCPWMTQYELAQCIPPAYTKHIGEILMKAIKGSAKNPSYNNRLPVRAVSSPLPNGEQNIKLDLFATSACFHVVRNLRQRQKEK